MSKKRIYCDISKVEDNEDGTITVSGFASSGAKDSDDEIVTPEAMKAAIPDYMKFGAVREMHQPSAAGTAISAEVQDDGRTAFSAKVVDDGAIKKVRTGVYKGFSIGGKVTKRNATDRNIIEGLNLIEVSLVDRPANPEALLTMYKAASTPEDDVEELAALLDGGTITAKELLELAKNSKNPTEEGGSVPVPPKGGSTGGTTDLQESTPTDITKGMYSVSDFACMLSSLSWLVSDSAWESEYEGDNSPIPAALLKWLQDGVEIFKGMVAEETAELLASLRALTNTPEIIEMAAKAGLNGVEKAGAKFSASTKAALADVHDSLKACCEKMDSLGYKTDDDTENAAQPETTKAAGVQDDTGGIAKAQQLVDDAIAKAVAPLKDQLEKLGKENSDLKAEVTKLNKQPAPGKALLKSLSKAADAAPVVDNLQPQETVPPEGTEARAAFEMRKVFSAGRV